MPENPPDENASEKERGAGPPERGGAWRADQRARGYYYDDACGYEVFDPDAADEDDAEPEPGDG